MWQSPVSSRVGRVRDVVLSSDDDEVPLFADVPLCFAHISSLIHRSSLFFFLRDDVAFFVSLVRGDVKLFDFGLAAIMPPNGDPYEDHFVMSGAGEKGGGMTTLEKTGPAEC